jgi:choline kinase
MAGSDAACRGVKGMHYTRRRAAGTVDSTRERGRYSDRRRVSQRLNRETLSTAQMHPQRPIRNHNTAVSLLAGIEAAAHDDILWLNGDVVFDEKVLSSIERHSGHNLVGSTRIK